jgi:hypothetical protein
MQVREVVAVGDIPPMTFAVNVIDESEEAREIACVPDLCRRGHGDHRCGAKKIVQICVVFESGREQEGSARSLASLVEPVGPIIGAGDAVCSR